MGLRNPVDILDELIRAHNLPISNTYEADMARLKEHCNVEVQECDYIDEGEMLHETIARLIIDGEIPENLWSIEGELCWKPKGWNKSVDHDH